MYIVTGLGSEKDRLTHHLDLGQHESHFFLSQSFMDNAVAGFLSLSGVDCICISMKSLCMCIFTSIFGEFESRTAFLTFVQSRQDPCKGVLSSKGWLRRK